MTATEWIAIASSVATVLGGAATAVAKLLLTAVRELVQGQKEQTKELVDGQKGTAAALGDVRIELVALRAHVDTLIDVTGPKRRVDELTPLPKSINGRKER